MENATQRLSAVRKMLHDACPNTPPALVAVSKTFQAADIAELYAAGQRDFGENYVREWQEKATALAHLPQIVWHIIGHVQSNKSRPVAEGAHWFHALDSVRLAQRLSAQRPEELPELNVCIEVNISGLPQRHGVTPEDATALARTVTDLPKLRFRGLMCVASADENMAVREFAQMKKLSDDLQASGLGDGVLSMGMSGDWPSAVANGATMVRIGRALFGERVAA